MEQRKLPGEPRHHEVDGYGRTHMAQAEPARSGPAGALLNPHARGVKLPMDLSQAVAVHMRVNLCGRNVCVAKHFLNHPKIRAII